MWHYVVIEIEKTFTRGKATAIGQSDGSVKYVDHRNEHKITSPCWNILYKAPIEYDEFSSMKAPKDAIAFKGCEVWLEQNKNEGSKYAIVKMYLV